MDICNYSGVKMCDEFGVNERLNLLFTEVCLLKNGISPTSLISYTGNNDACLNIIKPLSLNDILDKIILFSKNTYSRISSASLSLVTGSCGTATIELVPSSDANNNLRLGSDGKPFAGGINISATPNNMSSITTDGLVTLPNCTAIFNLFNTDVLQRNGVDRGTYDFLSTGVSGCNKISPPFSYAVTGNTRVSAFGALEYFSTLTLANASAISGETVLIFSDTTEDLVLKGGVNYHGVGQHSIGGLTHNSSTGFNITIQNLTVTGITTIQTLNAVITSSNLIFTKAVQLVNTKLINGSLIATSSNLSIPNFIQLNGKSIVQNFYANTGFYVYDSSLVNNCIGINSQFGELDAVCVLNTGNATISGITQPIVSNSYFYGKNISGLYVINGNYVGGNSVSSPVVSNVVGISDGSSGITIHNPYNYISGNSSYTNLTGLSSVSNGVYIFETTDGTFIPPSYDFNYLANISGINGFSTVSAGLLISGASISNSVGHSILGYGIVTGGAITFNCRLNNCKGESQNSSGLYLQSNIFINGGTYISNLDSSVGNPILISEAYPASSPGFYIINATTIARNINAYAIVSNKIVTMPIRISSNDFLNASSQSAILGIDNTGITYTGKTIALVTVTQDAYFNNKS